MNVGCCDQKHVLIIEGCSFFPFSLVVPIGIVLVNKLGAWSAIKVGILIYIYESPHHASADPERPFSVSTSVVG